MSERDAITAGGATPPDAMPALRRHYGCDLVDLTGSAQALYERHLLFGTDVGGRSVSLHQARTTGMTSLA